MVSEIQVPPFVKAIPYLRMAMDYYVAGRFSFLAHQFPVSANLLHHAVEMFLKSVLVLKNSDTKLKKKYGHDLNRLWQGFKALGNTPDLDAFDDFIIELHKWEEVRYPKQDQDTGLMSFWLDSNPAVPIEPQVSEDNSYSINLEEVDKFVAKFVETIHPVNPAYLLFSLSEEAREIYWTNNKHRIVREDQYYNKHPIIQEGQNSRNEAEAFLLEKDKD